MINCSKIKPRYHSGGVPITFTSKRDDEESGGGEIIRANIDFNTDQNQGETQDSPLLCLRCGICCSKHQARLTLPEAHTISAKLKISPEQFLAQYTDPRWPGTSSLLLRHQNGACVFLKRSTDKRRTLCQIHTFKPSCCREWTAGPQHTECLEGLRNTCQ